MTETRTPLLSVQHLCKEFPVESGVFGKRFSKKSVHAVNDVSFDIYPGETFGLVGESGCGKSTTGRCIMRLTHPTSGTVLFEGKDVAKMSKKELKEMRRNMQFIFQDPYASLNPRMTIGEIVSEPLIIHGVMTDPAGAIEFCDLAYGPQKEVLARECGDFLVRRSDGVFAYQLAVVVDDGLMGVNQVVRGRDLLGSCARQAYLARLLGLAAPAYGHVPLLTAPDGRRLSKRDQDLDLGALRQRGVPSRRIVGALAAAAGIAPKGEEASPEELLGRFSWEKIAAHRGDIVINHEFLLGLVG